MVCFSLGNCIFFFFFSYIKRHRQVSSSLHFSTLSLSDENIESDSTVIIFTFSILSPMNWRWVSSVNKLINNKRINRVNKVCLFSVKLKWVWCSNNFLLFPVISSRSTFSVALSFSSFLMNKYWDWDFRFFFEAMKAFQNNLWKSQHTFVKWQ